MRRLYSEKGTCTHGRCVCVPVGGAYNRDERKPVRKVGDRKLETAIHTSTNEVKNISPTGENFNFFNPDNSVFLTLRKKKVFQSSVVFLI